MLKRDLTLFLRCLGASALLLILFVSVSIGVVSVMIRATNTESDKIQVAIVDSEDSVLSRILIQTVGDTEYIRSLMKVETLEEDEAHRAIQTGEYAAAVLLPENFVNDMAHGIPAEGRVYISPMLISQGDILVSTLRFGERMLVAGQYGVFAGEHLLRKHGADSAARDSFLTLSNTGLLGAALSGSNTYFTNEVVHNGSSPLSTDAYFVLGAITSLLFLLSLSFSPLFLRDYKRGILCRLAAHKISTGRYMVWKILLLTLFRYVLCLAALLLLRHSLGLTLDPLAPLAASFFITVVGACLTVCTGDSITANTTLTLFGMLLCGGLVPRHLLPHSVQLLGRLTPFGAAEALLSPVFGTNTDWLGVGMACLYTVVSLLWIHAKTKRVLAGRDD